jgi:hypothetical protein
MFRKLLVPLYLTVTIGLAAVSELWPESPADAGSASLAGGSAVVRPAGRDSLTAKAVTAANAFKRSLSSSQHAAVQFSFNDPKKQSGWSNLPVSLAPRPGVQIADMSSEQVAKLRALLRTILSSRGYSDEEATRKANAYVAAQTGDPNGGLYGFGERVYYVAFFGTPSRSRKWTVHFGGHHLAIHMTFSGEAVSHTPYFVGVEPPTRFEVDGRTYAPMADETAALFGAVKSLDSDRLEKARLSQRFDDVLVGPQKDGQFPRRQGITVGDLSASQQRRVTRAIRSYVDDIPTRQASALLTTYKRQYSRTSLAWSGATDPKTIGSYVRLHGPRLWIEIATQNAVVVMPGVHYHSIERDIKTDYGAGG